MENMGELGDRAVEEATTTSAASSTGAGSSGAAGDPVDSSVDVASVDDHTVDTVDPPDLLPAHELTADIGRSDSEEVSGNMIDATDFRALAEPAYASLNGRLSPGFSTASSYATLTPLQPLPPISTMSDKFSHYAHPGNVTGSFTLMQNNLGMGMNFQYDKLGAMGGMNMSPTLGVTHASAVSMLAANGLGSQSGGIPSPPYSQNGLHSPEKSLSPTGFETYAHRELSRDLGSPQSPTSALHTPTSMMQTLNGLNAPHTPPPAQLQAPATPPSSHEMKPTPTLTATPMTVPVVSLAAPSPTPINVTLSLSSAIPVQVTVQPTTIVTSPVTPAPAPSSSGNAKSVIGAVTGVGSSSTSSSSSATSKSGSGDEVEEINTKELAQRISAELKRYSIPQAIFAQRVLCRSQGTLSDLLRNPKPWSKLKSGRETFRRMYKWLEEPEFQRMSALRLAGAQKLEWISSIITASEYLTKAQERTKAPLHKKMEYPSLYQKAVAV